MSKELESLGYKTYRKTGVQYLRPYIPGEDLTGISVNKEDKHEIGTVGGMVACNPNNLEDKWYVAKDFFKEKYELVE